MPAEKLISVITDTFTKKRSEKEDSGAVTQETSRIENNYEKEKESGFFDRLLDEKKKARIKHLLLCAANAALGFFFGRAVFPFGIRPCAPALLFSERRYTLFVFLGFAASCFSYTEGPAYLALAVFSLVIRAYISERRFDEDRRNKIILSSVISLFCGLLLAFSGGLSGRAFLSAAFYTVSVPFLTFFISAIFEPKTNKKAVGYDGGVCIFVLLTVYSLGGISYPVNISLVISCFAVLYAAIYGGTGAGALFGLSCGAGLELCGLPHGFAVILGLSGIFCGMARSKYRILPYALFSVSFFAICMYTVESPYEYIKTMLFSVLLFVPLYKLIPFLPISENSFILFPTDTPENTPEAYTKEGSFDKLSKTFSSLSEIFYNVSDKQKYPTKEEIYDMIDSVCEKYCGKCSLYGKCYSRKLFASENIEDILYCRLCSGGIKKSDLPEKYAESCIKLPDIIEKLNDGYSDMVNEYFKNNKTEILASEYSAMARMIKYTQKKEKLDRTPDAELTRTVNTALCAMGLRFMSVRVFGTRVKTVEISGVSLSALTVSGKELSAKLSEKTHIEFSDPEYRNIGISKLANITLTQKKKIRLEYAQAQCAKDGGNTNGDSASFFESDEQYFYALISDGMGSGRSAALTSRLTSIFIEKLLTTGAHKNVTLELLNDLLLSKNDESFATVDLLEIDLISGSASFIKAGAAPAYIVRASKLYKIASSTPPCGIIKSFGAEKTNFTLEKGDMVLMLSDGIIQSSDEVPWLCEMLSFSPDDNPSKLANRILSKAKKFNIREDDMTCVAVRVV